MLYRTDNVKQVRTGRGIMTDYPDVAGIDRTTWRWVSKQHGIFETKTALVGVAAAPSHYPGLFAIAKLKSDGKIVTDGVGIHDNENNVFAVVSPTKGVLVSKDITLTECKETDAGAVQVLPKVPVVPSDNDLDWTEGIPKEMTIEELVPEVCALSDNDLKAILAKRGVDVGKL
jgi:hypothetical protein